MSTARGRGTAAAPRPYRALGVAMCLVTLLAGCTVGPSQRPPVAVRGETVAAPPAPAVPSTPDPVPPLQPQNSSIPFADCTGQAFSALGVAVPAGRDLRVECGELPVPADPLRPERGAVLLAVVRVGEPGGLDRPPLLAVGDSVTGPTVRHALVLGTQVSAAVLEKFTVVGIDRRGAGSDRLDCGRPDARAALVDADPAATSEAELTPLLEQARAVVQGCNITPSIALGSYGSAAGAADVERLRDRLGVAQLSAVGVGDGAGLLAAWAAAAPGAVGRLVLDGPPDPAAPEPDRSTARAAAAEATFDAFAGSCTGSGACPLGADPRAAVTALLDALRARPLAAPDGRRLTAGGAVTAVLNALPEPRSWPALAAATAAAAAGDPVALLDLLEPSLGIDGTFDGRLATACNDNPARLSPPEVAELAEQLRADHPLLGGAIALEQLACAPWPASVTPAAPVATALPPVLVVGTVADPRAPHDGARRVADTLPTGVFVSWQGAGSGAYPRTPCVNAAVDTLLVGGAVPASGTLCPP
ncbi:alpha/beta hydrolase [Pseudonocardia sp.]|uniref:alpha/beta hydrolase n=1 Tax=Pseudonocardia sp. TaxID=60912 RepID=UPI002628BACF|nr:alpha/beta hydrolase [Pseudonocardia sp.]